MGCNHVRYVLNVLYMGGDFEEFATNIYVYGVKSLNGITCGGCYIPLPIALLEIVTDFLTCRTEEWPSAYIPIIDKYLTTEVLPVVMAGLNHPFLECLSYIRRTENGV